MSSDLDVLIEGLKHELQRECDRVRGTVFRQKVTEQREVSSLRRLEQRIAVLESLRTRDAVGTRGRSVASRHGGTANPTVTGGRP